MTVMKAMKTMVRAERIKLTHSFTGKVPLAASMLTLFLATFLMPGVYAAAGVREEMIPELCRYVVFDTEGNVREGSIEAHGIGDAWSAVTENRRSIGTYFYKTAVLDSGYCVMRYRMIAQYCSDILRKYLPPPEAFIIICVLLCIVTHIIWISVRFGRVLRKRMQPLILAAEKIKGGQLSFTVSRSGIREIDAVLHSLDKMRMALRESLEAQWQAEQLKREQISALAHDLKTPLTLLRGNAELLYDTELTEEQKESVDYIESSSLQMQAYVQTLIEVSRSQDALKLKKEKIDLAEFLKELEKQCRGLCGISRIHLQWDNTCQIKEIYADKAFLTRALFNIVTNAIEHTPAAGNIIFTVSEEEKEIAFKVADSGCGFSKEALVHAKEQFYMDDTSRSSRTHFGIGLYAADTIAGCHGGRLSIRNLPKTHGAEVILTIAR
ncbi:MAG: HAMP domain-containing histidine kinase [Ruminococcus sp.]|nr:HAMP domain-containing histidine kinase [Ruminococcus sp.]